VALSSVAEEPLIGTPGSRALSRKPPPRLHSRTLKNEAPAALSSWSLITHKLRLFGNRWLMYALPPKADIRQMGRNVRFVPIADIKST